MITIYTIAFNEEFMLPYFIRHYRAMFPGCAIVVYDNESTDATVEIAKAAGCEVITYSTGGKLDDMTYLQLKNNCWKSAKTNWVLVADVDEFCDINAERLKHEELHGATAILFHGYNMVNMSDTMDVEDIMTGIRSKSYDKMYCFERHHIQEVNYGPGCHTAAPVGLVQDSYGAYRCRHFKYINPDYMVKRHAAFAQRLSDENLRKGYGGHYLYTEAQIRKEFDNARLSAKIIY